MTGHIDTDCGGPNFTVSKWQSRDLVQDQTRCAQGGFKKTRCLATDRKTNEGNQSKQWEVAE